MQLDCSKNKPTNTLKWHYSAHIFKPLWFTFLGRASLLKLGGLHKGIKQNRSSPAETQDWPVVSLQPPLWPGTNEEDEAGAQLAGISFNFAHLAASNSPLAHEIYPNQFQWACGREGQAWRQSGKENKGIHVQTWDMHCQVLSCPPTLISSGRYSQNSTQLRAALLCFHQHREQEKVNRAHVSQYEAWANQQFWQHPELAAGSIHLALPLTHRLNPDKSPRRLQFLWLLIRDIGTFFEVVQRTWRSIQSAEDFFPCAIY